MAQWFEFYQNNSGGSFDYDEEQGITHFVIIEAESRDKAIDRAEEIGLYFDGCDAGMDCDCCGDRWYRGFGEGSEYPTVYGQDIRKDGGFVDSWDGWMKEGREVAIHPLNGLIEWYGVIKK